MYKKIKCSQLSLLKTIFSPLFFVCLFLLTSCASLDGTGIIVVHADDSYFDASDQSNDVISFREFRWFAEKGLLAAGVYNFQRGIYQLDETLTISNDYISLVAHGHVEVRGKGRHSFPGMKLAASNVVVEGFSFSDLRHCISNEENVPVNDIVIRGLSAKNVKDCILVQSDKSSSSNRWLISGFEINDYYRAGVRIKGRGVKNIKLESGIINGWSDSSYCWKGGVQVYQGASNIRINELVIVNNIGECHDRYQQGDGIEVDNTTDEPRNITISNVYLSGNADANLDIKSSKVTLENIFIDGVNSRSALKLWYYNYRCNNCYWSKESSYAIELKHMSTFENNCSADSLNIINRKVERSVIFDFTGDRDYVCLH